MSSASQLLYGHMGAPAVVGALVVDAGFACWICGSGARLGLTVREFLPPTFVGQSRARAPGSNHVCAACACVMAGRPPDTMRMYSHLVDDRGWLKLNKGDKAQMRDWLRAPKRGPWFAAIADSGQKHVIPWAPVNPPNTSRGRVMLEETEVLIPIDHAAGWTLVDRMTDLLTAGATKEDIGRGDYGQGSVTRCGEQIRAFEASWASKRGSGWFDLALWLAQRDEEQAAARMDVEKAERAAKKDRDRDRRKPERKSADRNRRGAARDPSVVPGNAAGERTEALSTDRGSAPVGSAHDDRARGVGDHDGAVASVVSAQQSLFGGAFDVDSPRARKAVRK